VHAFHRRLCQVKVLDPACGSGNFLYVTLERMKRLEGEALARRYICARVARVAEVLDTLVALGQARREGEAGYAS
jgi:type I restriction-modification system DNA methylase subunit